MNDGQRLYQWLLALVAGLSLCGLASAADEPSTLCAIPDNSSTITTCIFDLTKSPSSTQTAGSEVLNGGLFRVPASDGDLGQGYTGVLPPFVRIQAGSNTGGQNGSWNQPIKLGQIPKVTVCDGGGTTGTNCKQYYEFLLFVNERVNSAFSGISLDAFKLFSVRTGDIPDVTGADDSKRGITQPAAGPHRAAGAAGSRTTLEPNRPRPAAPLRVQRVHLPGETDVPLTGATLQYDMDAASGGDASLLLDYRNYSGSGNGVDLQALVPVSHFAGVAADSFVYLYSKFGGTSTDGTTIAGGIPAGKLSFGTDVEWSIRQGGLPGQTPTPPTVLLLALGLAGLVTVRQATGARRNRASRV